MDGFRERRNLKDGTPPAKRSMLDAFNEITQQRKDYLAHRVTPLEVFNEQLQGQWPEPAVPTEAETAAAAAATHPLQLVDATTGTPPVATIRVRAGSIGGEKADSSMDLVDDDPVFSFSSGITGSAGTKYVYCTVTMEYDTATGIWSRDTGIPNEISAAGSLPAATATTMTVQLGTVEVVSDSGGYSISSITQTVSGNQWIARTGSGTTYVDANGLL